MDLEPILLPTQAKTRALQWSTDGSKLTWATDDAKINLIRPSATAESQERPRSALAHPQPVTSIAWHGDKFVTVANDESVFLWDSRTPRITQKTTANGPKAVNFLAKFAPTGRLAVASTANSIAIFDLTGTQLQPVQQFTLKDKLNDMAWTNDGQKLICTADTGVLIYSGDQLLSHLNVSSSPVTSITYQDDFFIVGTKASEVQVIETQDLATTKSIEDVDDDIASVDYASGYLVVTYGVESPAIIYSLENTDHMYTIEDCKSGECRPLAKICPSNHTFIAYTDDRGRCNLLRKTRARAGAIPRTTERSRLDRTRSERPTRSRTGTDRSTRAPTRATASDRARSDRPAARSDRISTRSDRPAVRTDRSSARMDRPTTRPVPRTTRRADEYRPTRPVKRRRN